MPETANRRVTITIELDVTLKDSQPHGPRIAEQEPYEMSVARQINALLRDGSVNPSSLFVFHSCDVSLGTFSGLFAIENPEGYRTR
jgi:hypothetical protein